MLNGIMATAQKHGYTILICDSMDSSEKLLKNITYFVNANLMV